MDLIEWKEQRIEKIKEYIPEYIDIFESEIHLLSHDLSKTNHLPLSHNIKFLNGSIEIETTPIIAMAVFENGKTKYIKADDPLTDDLLWYSESNANTRYNGDKSFYKLINVVPIHMEMYGFENISYIIPDGQSIGMNSDERDGFILDFDLSNNAFCFLNNGRWEYFSENENLSKKDELFGGDAGTFLIPLIRANFDEFLVFTDIKEVINWHRKKKDTEEI